MQPLYALTLTCQDRFPVGTEISAHRKGRNDSWSSRREGVRGRPLAGPPPSRDAHETDLARQPNGAALIEQSRQRPAREPVSTAVMGPKGAYFRLPAGRFFFSAMIGGDRVIISATAGPKG